ncbi:alkane 1-monooxygenase [Roseiarcaceae bacterium H3SJ34-1]|uniref:alkane 1-monooxygenase n=1 Tax=Terripilifer ovatus TaxID=3032367 RepID=UPI003AB91D5C|nr:alkane 1-monooxygenase [Roseiarcaceae bacterium H3SJ34-1]
MTAPNVSALRFSSANLLFCINIALLLVGGVGLWAGYLLIVLLKTALDEVVGDTDEQEVAGSTAFMDMMALLTLPLLAVNSLLFAFYFSPAESTWLGAALAPIGIDFDGARRGTTWFDMAGAFISMGALYGMAMNVAHELVHRTTDRVAYTFGRWLSAFSWESSFALQHMTGHHMNAGYYEDSGTARRGENVYAFVLRASVGNNIFAWRAESNRLRRRGLSLWSLHNRFLIGQAMTLAIAAAFYACGGWLAVAAFAIVGFQGRFYLEAAAFIEHYGLVRVPGTRTEARHSWNSYRAISNTIIYNVARHADHHLHAGKPFYKLLRDDDAPQLPHGYLTMFAISLVPPLYARVMKPHLLDWDMHYATEAERRYLRSHGKPVWEPAAVPAE